MEPESIDRLPLPSGRESEGGGDRTKAFDAYAVEEAAMEREEGEDL